MVSHLRKAIKRLAYNIDKSKLNTLWYENEHGDKHVPDLSGDMPPDIPEGFKYQLSQFPTQLNMTMLEVIDQEDVDACPHPEEDIRKTYGWIDGMEGRECALCSGTQEKDIDEDWPDEWDGYGSREVLSGSSGWDEDLVLAMANSGDFTLSEAVLVSADSCERCWNSLIYDYGLEGGYKEGSQEWQESNTSCEFCESIQ